MNEIFINGFKICDNSYPYLIAEIGVNHEGSIDKAKMLVELAKEGGANAAKFQTYKADSLASKNSPYYWDLSKEKTTSQYQLFKKYDSFGPDEYEILAEHCKKIDIDFLSTPFDEKSVEFLDPLMPAYKIASADITNLPLLEAVAKKTKPIFLSTGASNLEEINYAIKIINQNGNNKVALLHCILNYPTSNDNANLLMIKGLRKSFPNNIIGYSDHTLPLNNMMSLNTSYILGARIIEKHFTHDKSLEGNDHYHAMDVEDLKLFKKNLLNLKELIGSNYEKKAIESEKIAIKNARRSIVLKKNVNKNEILTNDILICKRPGTGISPKELKNVIGRSVKSSLKEDHILQWCDLN